MSMLNQSQILNLCRVCVFWGWGVNLKTELSHCLSDSSLSSEGTVLVLCNNLKSTVLLYSDRVAEVNKQLPAGAVR